MCSFCRLVLLTVFVFSVSLELPLMSFSSITFWLRNFTPVFNVKLWSRLAHKSECGIFHQM